MPLPETTPSAASKGMGMYFLAETVPRHCHRPLPASVAAAYLAVTSAADPMGEVVAFQGRVRDAASAGLPGHLVSYVLRRHGAA